MDTRYEISCFCEEEGRRYRVGNPDVYPTPFITEISSHHGVFLSKDLAIAAAKAYLTAFPDQKLTAWRLHTVEPIEI